MLAGILLGLAVLTKGPVAYLVVALIVCAYWLVKRFRARFNLTKFLLFSAITGLTFGSWYALEMIQNGSWFITEFIRYQIALFIEPGAGHAGFPGYHFVVLFFGCFPASILAINTIFHNEEIDTRRAEFRFWMILLMAVVLALFTIVQSKIVHYSSLCYFPLTFFATLYVWRRMQAGTQIGRWQTVLISVVGVLYVCVGILLVYLGMHAGDINKYIMLDPNFIGSLSMDVHWQWWHILPVVFLASGIIGFLRLRRQPLKSIIALYVGSALFIYTGIFCWVGKIQQYTQGPSTEFFTSLRSQDVYAVTWGHKSFSPYWDFRKPMPEGFSTAYKTAGETPYVQYSDTEFLLTSPTVSKDVYILTKANKADIFEQRHPNVRRIRDNGGFVYFIRPHQE
jgi:hypothetical protein